MTSGEGISADGEVAGDIRYALTILWHPDLGRVGEHLLLAELDRGGVAEVSRLSPPFVAAAEGGYVATAALADPYLSRTPFRFRRSSAGGVALECGETNTWIAIDGERSLLGRTLGRAELLRGVVLLLANRVVLLLHGLWPDEPRAQNRKIEVTRLFLRYLRTELQRLGRESLIADPGPYAQPWLPAPILDRLLRYPWPGERYQIKSFARRLAEQFADRAHVADAAQVERLLLETAERRGDDDSSSGELSSPFILGDGYVRREPSEVSETELLQALLRNRWQLGPTARQLGISRPTLFTMIDEMSAATEQRMRRGVG